MINVLASIQVKPGKMKEFLPICKANIPNVRQESGCIEYAAAIDVDADLEQSWARADTWLYTPRY